MSTQVVLASGWLDRTSKLRQILDLLAAVRDLDGSLIERDGLRAYVALVLRFAELFGLDAAWIERLRGVLDNEAALELLLALVRFAASWMSRFDAETNDEVRAALAATPTVDAAALAEWLPLVLWLLETWRRLRGQP